MSLDKEKVMNYLSKKLKNLKINRKKGNRTTKLCSIGIFKLQQECLHSSAIGVVVYFFNDKSHFVKKKLSV